MIVMAGTRSVPFAAALAACWCELGLARSFAAGFAKVTGRAIETVGVQFAQFVAVSAESIGNFLRFHVQSATAREAGTVTAGSQSARSAAGVA